jgi:tripartite-type tricarboxylate transporter receptor subunit TctC
MIVYPAAHPKPQYVLEDFVPITNIASMPNLISVNPKFPANNLTEFIAVLKANPDKYSFATSGVGSINHMLGESFQAYSGTKIVHVPYKGSGPAMQDVMGGQVDILFDQFPSSKNFVDTGKLKAIGAITPQKVPGYPNLMTMEDGGLKGFTGRGVVRLLAPARTPAGGGREAHRRHEEGRWPTRSCARSSRRSARARSATRPRSSARRVKSEIERMKKLVKNATSSCRSKRGPGAPMKVAIIGAGPAGLYLAYLLKRRQPGLEVRVLEQNPPNATFGSAWSSRPRPRIPARRRSRNVRGDHPGARALVGHHARPRGRAGAHRRRRLFGHRPVASCCSSSRTARARRASGSSMDRAVASLAEVGDADLVVGADGVNSLVRRTYESAFGATVTPLANRFAWYGTAKPFETLTQTSADNEHGAFNAHHYRYSPRMSTFIVETDAQTWGRAGFEWMEADATQSYLEAARSPTCWTATRWFPTSLRGGSSRRCATRIGRRTTPCSWAMRCTPPISPSALARGSPWKTPSRSPRRSRRTTSCPPRCRRSRPRAVRSWRSSPPRRTRARTGTSVSPRTCSYAPMDFAMSYVTRSGRVDMERLRRASPAFAAAYESSRNRPRGQ